MEQAASEAENAYVKYEKIRIFWGWITVAE